MLNGFLRARGRIITDGEGREVILRGWGMGNWDNPEGFMTGTVSTFDIAAGKWQPAGRMDRGRTLEQIVTETCGTAYASTFRDRWNRAWLDEKDIALLAARGYNSVRLPVRANSFLKEEPGIEYREEGFRMLEDVLSWCEKHDIRAIIDIHAATAGQSCLPCDDAVDNAPHFFLDDEARERMLILMEEFARRYADRVVIGAYDLLNEPLSVTPRLSELTPALADFYRALLRRFRAIDKNHLMLLNGTQFSSNVDVFREDFDPECHNWGIAIHMYDMVSPEMISIADALDASERLNVPVWMGETGSENAQDWQVTMYSLLAEHHIGFNVWSWKTCEGASCAKALTFRLPKDWHRIVDYACAGGAKPSYAESVRIWDEYLEAVRFDNCTEDTAYYAAQLRDGSYGIPAIAYDDAPDGRKGARKRPSSAMYRLSDGMNIVWEKGFYPVTPFPGMPLGGEGRAHMRLRLNEGEYVTYTLRNTGAWTLWLDCACDAADLVVTDSNTVLYSDTLRDRVEGDELSVIKGQGPAHLRFEVRRGTLELKRLRVEA